MLIMEVKYRSKELSPCERVGVIAKIDEVIAIYSEAAMRYRNEKLNCRKGDVPIKHLAEFLETVELAAEFSAIVVADCAVSQKFFLLASSDYEKRFARGKLKVILNEGFKMVYGFTKSQKDSRKMPVWERIGKFVSLFPENLKVEYDEITGVLEKCAKDDWWRYDRNCETHLDVEDLYESRREELIESKVIMESMELLNILFRLHEFTAKLYDSYCETLWQAYLKQYTK